MKYYGPIPQPMEKVVTLDKQEDILDVVFDMKVPNMEEALALTHGDSRPKLLIMTNRAHDIFIVISYRGPSAWKVTEDQVLKAWAGPHLEGLFLYFVEERSKTDDLDAKIAFAHIVNYIQELIKSRKQRSSSNSFLTERK